MQEEIKQLGPKARNIKALILKLCNQNTYSAEQIARIFNRNITDLKEKHLAPMCEDGLIAYTFPEVRNHPNQAYVITEKGKQFLKQKM